MGRAQRLSGQPGPWCGKQGILMREGVLLAAGDGLDTVLLIKQMTIMEQDSSLSIRVL